MRISTLPNGFAELSRLLGYNRMPLFQNHRCHGISSDRQRPVGITLVPWERRGLRHSQLRISVAYWLQLVHRLSQLLARNAINNRCWQVATFLYRLLLRRSGGLLGQRCDKVYYGSRATAKWEWRWPPCRVVLDAKVLGTVRTGGKCDGHLFA